MTEMGSSDTRGDEHTLTQIVTMRCKPEHEQEFVELATSIVQTVHEQEPGTILYAPPQTPVRCAYIRVGGEVRPCGGVAGAHGSALYRGRRRQAAQLAVRTPGAPGTTASGA